MKKSSFVPPDRRGCWLTLLRLMFSGKIIQRQHTFGINELAVQATQTFAGQHPLK